MKRKGFPWRFLRFRQLLSLQGELSLKSLGVLFLAAGIALGAYTLYEKMQPRGAMTVENFRVVWERDLAFLKEKSRLHEGFENLKMVEFTSSDDQVRGWIEIYKPDFGIQSTGMYKLEVLLDTWNDEKEKGVIVQYHLVNLTTGDTIWELGRTLTLIQ